MDCLIWRREMNISSPTMQAQTPPRCAPNSTFLEDENRRYQGTGGISQENHPYGFLPAFLDASTGSVYLSRFPDGRRALIHLLDSLPEKLVL
jgi:hypothetical protein